MMGCCPKLKLVLILSALHRTGTGWNERHVSIPQKLAIPGPHGYDQRDVSGRILMFVWGWGSYHCLSHHPVNLRDPGLPVCIVLRGCMSIKARCAPQQSLWTTQTSSDVLIFLSEAKIQLQVCMHEGDLLCRPLYPCLILPEYQWETSQTWRFEKCPSPFVITLMNPVNLICVDQRWHLTGGRQGSSTL